MIGVDMNDIDLKDLATKIDQQKNSNFSKDERHVRIALPSEDSFASSASHTPSTKSTQTLMERAGAIAKGSEQFLRKIFNITSGTNDPMNRDIADFISEVSKDLVIRKIEKGCENEPLSNLFAKIEKFHPEKFLLALKRMAFFAQKLGLMENEVLGKFFMVKIFQPMLHIGKNLEVPLKSMAKFDTCVLISIDQEEVEKAIVETLATKTFQFRNFPDYVNKARRVIINILNASPKPNASVFHAVEVDNPSIQKIVLNSLLKFGEGLKVES
ncbi:MAG: hypothetical protein LBF94_03105 [Puniceicoccales bacterium]|nr:hypothetical protein [Puniceicoccales bacterium]